MEKKLIEFIRNEFATEDDVTADVIHGEFTTANKESKFKSSNLYYKFEIRTERFKT